MKKIFETLVILFLSTSFMFAQEIKFELYDGDKAQAKDLATNDERSGAQFKQSGATTEWNYGTIEKSSTGVRFFKFTNTGQKPLIISKAKGSCGCTVPSYPKEAIMPGASAYIKVKYDTKRVGPFTKYVTLTTNATANTSTRLKISGVVEVEAAPIPTKQKNLFD